MFGLAGSLAVACGSKTAIVRNSGWHPERSREVLIPRELSLPGEVWGCVDSLPSTPLSGPGATKRD